MRRVSDFHLILRNLVTYMTIWISLFGDQNNNAATSETQLPGRLVEEYFRRLLFICFVENSSQAFAQKFELHQNILSSFQCLLRTNLEKSEI